MAKNNKITQEMTFGEILEKHPEAGEIMLKHGLHCIGCHIAPHESIGQGAMAHGMSKSEIESLLKDLNKSAKK